MCLDDSLQIIEGFWVFKSLRKTLIYIYIYIYIYVYILVDTLCLFDDKVD